MPVISAFPTEISPPVADADASNFAMTFVPVTSALTALIFSPVASASRETFA